MARVGEPQNEKWDVHVHKGARITEKWWTIDAKALVVPYRFQSEYSTADGEYARSTGRHHAPDCGSGVGGVHLSPLNGSTAADDRALEWHSDLVL